jgi:hypothetical protein
MKTAVETIFIGKDRQYNRRFLQICSHHLVEPVACTPASGWEKGQVRKALSLPRRRCGAPDPTVLTRAGDHVVRRPLDIYTAVGRRLAAQGGLR